jgi:hypothetical protein
MIKTPQKQIFGDAHAWYAGIEQGLLWETTEGVGAHLLASSTVGLAVDRNTPGRAGALPG